MPAPITAAFAMAAAFSAAVWSAWPATPLTAADIRDATYGLSISTSVDERSQNAGGEVTYRIVVANSGSTVVRGATVIDDVPGTVTDVHWSCAADGGATCDAGTGDGGRIAVTTVLPPGGRVTIVARGTVTGGAAGGTILNRASVDVPSRALIAGGVILSSDPVTTRVPAGPASEAPMPTSRLPAGAAVCLR